jgi:hypothetical protein
VICFELREAMLEVVYVRIKEQLSSVRLKKEVFLLKYFDDVLGLNFSFHGRNIPR